MSINLNSQFASVPVLNHSRSTYDMSCNIKTSFNVGDVVPFFCTEVLPGDTWKLDTNKVLRMPPLVTAPMDNLYLDTYYFFVPNRILWEHWRDFLGENRQSAWIPSTEYEIPQLKAPSNGWSRGTIADYLGIPIGIGNLSVNALPFRAYAMIIDEWFRSENLQDPLNIPKTDAVVTGSNGSNYVTDVAKGGKPFVANKFFDLFTSCLPSPQKGPDVTLSVTGDVPVYTSRDYDISNYNISDRIGVPRYKILNYNGNSLSEPDSSVFPTDSYNRVLLSNNGSSFYQYISSTFDSSTDSSYSIAPSNLFADTSSSFMITINQLRQAFQVQRFYEKNARSGSRYRELLKAHFGVTLEDSRAMVPEYLGGNRVPINISQVSCTSTTSESVLGDVGGLSITNDSHIDFQKSFTEHGLLMGVCVARYKHTYSQGLQKMWSKKDKFDFFWPTLANLGETAVLNKEIYCKNNTKDDEVFGYQEAWYEYRYLPDLCTGAMRPASSNADSLALWHFGDFYSTLPKLSSDWLKEDAVNVDRVLAVPAIGASLATNQIFADILVSSVTTRVVPTYSIPGLIDHN